MNSEFEQAIKAITTHNVDEALRIIPSINNNKNLIFENEGELLRDGIISTLDDGLSMDIPYFILKIYKTRAENDEEQKTIVISILNTISKSVTPENINQRILLGKIRDVVISLS